MRGVAVVELITAVVGLMTGCATSAPAIPVTQRPAEVRTEPAAAPSAVRQGSGLFFSVTPTDAEIYIDGKAKGKVADLEASGGVLGIKPGIYQVSLKRRGFVTWRAEVTVGDVAEAIQVIMVESQ